MKEYEGHIGVREGTVLVFTVLTALLFLQLPQFMVEVGGPAGWQVALVSTASAVVMIMPMGALAHRFPGLGLAEISRETAGPFFGPLLTLVVTLWLTLTTAIALRNMTETFLVSILPNTPPSALILVAISVAIFSSYAGIEAIGRATQVLLPLIVAGTVLLLIFSLPRADLSMLFPVWGHDPLNTLGGGIFYGSVAAECIFLLAAGYAFRDGKSFTQSGLWGILLWGALASATVAVLVSVFGSPTTAENPFPLYNLARLVYLGRFFQRTESLTVMLWFFASAVRISVLLHATVVSLAGSLRVPAYRPLLFPLSVILVSLALLPEDFLTVLRTQRDWVRASSFIVLGVPLVLLLLALIRKKGGQANAA